MGIRPLVGTALIGLVAGLVAVAFGLAADWLPATFLVASSKGSLLGLRRRPSASCSPERGSPERGSPGG